MRKVIVGAMVSMDGVMQAPASLMAIDEFQADLNWLILCPS